MADFEQAVSFVFKHEGGYTPGIPDDPGGETNFGISKRAFPDLDIKNLTIDQAKEIYRKHYWNVELDGEPDQKLANCLLDCAVNQGPSFAAKLHRPYCDLICVQVERLIRYATLNKPKFNHSWFYRVLDV